MVEMGSVISVMTISVNAWGKKTTNKVVNHDWKIEDLNKWITHVNGSLLVDDLSILSR